MIMKQHLNERLGRLSAEKIRRLVETVGRKGTGEEQPMVPPGGEEYFPLSGAQEGIWLSCRFSANQSIYNNPVVLQMLVSRELDMIPLNRSFDLLVRRHEILRTGFTTMDEKPAQFVVPAGKPGAQIAFIDLQMEVNREEKCKEIAVREGLMPFDLHDPPLLRLTLLRLRPLEYLLLITSHHLISDGWSNMLFTRELMGTYDSLEKGISPEREAAPRYIHHVLTERSRMRTADYDADLSFWKTNLQDLPMPLQLPVDYARGDSSSLNGGMEDMYIPDELFQSANIYCKLSGVTLFQFFITVFNILLFHYTQQEDIIVGIPLANRGKKDALRTLGLFMNILPLRTRLTGADSFRKLGEQARASCREIMSHQEVPFHKIVDILGLARSTTANPVFQVAFAYQQVPDIQTDGLARYKVDYGISKYDLNIWLEESTLGLSITLTYNSNIFRPGTAGKILKHFTALAKCALAAPDLPVSSLPFLEGNDKSCLYGETSPAAENSSFIRRFESNVRCHPNIFAVDDTCCRLTYPELNNRANKLSRYLIYNKVKPGDVVMLLARRNVAFVTGLLAILKCGATFLPVDDSVPAERLRQILDDSGCGLILTERELADLPGDIPVSMIVFGEEMPFLTSGQNGNPEIYSGKDSAVYLIYTSGTSGKPKGVCIQNRQVSNYIEGISSRIRATPGERYACLSSLAFDLAYTMVFPALSQGGTLVLVPFSLATNPARLEAHFGDSPPEYMKIVPGHLRSLMAVGDTSRILPQKLVILGGESLTPALAKAIRAAKPQCRVMHHYGPTETTIGVLTFEIANDDFSEHPLVPIGKPLPNTYIYLLSRYGHPVPRGTAGEICIGGEQLANGYYKMASMSESPFIPDPFQQGRRLYRTGDIGKMLEDGSVLFLGRSDTQMKLRGYRLEAREVEAMLEKHPAIRSSVVLTRNECLVAFLECDVDCPPDTGELQLLLKKRLPRYMIPDRYVFLPVLPRTANGKIDQNKLDDQPLSLTRNSPENPCSAMEGKLLRVWQATLRNSSPGTNDNFFEIGGNSMLAIELLAKINRDFPVNIGIEALFQYPTIKELAAFLQQLPVAGKMSPLVILNAGRGGTPILLAHPAGGDIFCYRQLAGFLNPQYPLFAFTRQGAQAGKKDFVTIAQMAQQYFDEIPSVYAGLPVIFGGWSMGGYVAFEMACLYSRKYKCHPEVIIFDQVAPGSSDGQVQPVKEEVEQLLIFARKAEQFLSKNLDITADTLLDRDSLERSELFFREFKKAGLLLERITPADFHGFLDFLVLDNKAAIEYTPAVFDGNVLLIKAVDRAVEANSNSLLPDLGWQQYCQHEVTIAEVPGTHASMMSEMNVKAVAEVLSNWLSRDRDRSFRF